MLAFAGNSIESENKCNETQDITDDECPIDFGETSGPTFFIFTLASGYASLQNISVR